MCGVVPTNMYVDGGKRSDLRVVGVVLRNSEFSSSWQWWLARMYTLYTIHASPFYLLHRTPGLSRADAEGPKKTGQKWWSASRFSNLSFILGEFCISAPKPSPRGPILKTALLWMRVYLGFLDWPNVAKWDGQKYGVNQWLLIFDYSCQ